MEDRDGGGWTLGLKNWFGSASGPRFDGDGRRATNDIDSGVMDKLGKFYKMDDTEIRTYMGQPDPADDAFDAEASEMNIMRDQTGIQDHYGISNREYTIMKKYTARWYWYVPSVRLEWRHCVTAAPALSAASCPPIPTEIITGWYNVALVSAAEPHTLPSWLPYFSSTV